MAILALTMGPHLGIIMVPTVLGVGSAGTITFKAVGANGNVRWKLVSSNLPNEWDAALNVSGGQATLETDEIEVPGTFTVTVQCTDESRVPVVRTFAVRLMALPLTISGAFPEWKVGQPATGSLTISGGVPPYSGLSITSGALPAGVSLSIVGNQIVPSGTPTSSGDGTITIQVSDSDGTPANSSFEYTIANSIGADILAKLQAWYPFNSNLVDVHGGYDRSGGGTITYSPGVVGNCMSNNDIMEGGVTPPALRTSKWSIGGWFRISDTNAKVICAVNNRTPGNEPIHIHWTGSQFQMGLYSPANGQYVVIHSATGIDPVNLWHFLVMTRDGDDVRAYIGSSFIGSGSAGSYFDNLASLRFGDWYAGLYNSKYDEVFVASEVLTPEEITWLYNSGAGRSYSDLGT